MIICEALKDHPHFVDDVCDRQQLSAPPSPHSLTDAQHGMQTVLVDVHLCQKRHGTTHRSSRLETWSWSSLHPSPHFHMTGCRAGPYGCTKRFFGVLASRAVCTTFPRLVTYPDQKRI